MKCENAKDLLLTDYQDKELSGEKRGELEGHLTSCSGCRAFLRQAQEALAVSFRDLPRLEPPKELWSKIEARLDEESARGPFWEDLKERVAAIWPRKTLWVPALGLAASLIAVGLWRQPTLQPVAKTETPPELGVLTGWPEETAQAPAEESDEYGTPIEEYFL